MLEGIVVGYAGDRAGRDGVVLAAQLAHVARAQLTVVFPYHPLCATIPGAVAEQQARGELQALLGGSPVLEGAHFRWSNASWPIRALHEIAAYEEAQLIVFGAAPERLERRHVALMARMVHGAPCAVAAAPSGYADRERRALRCIGVGFADTPDGHLALRVGCQLARELDGEACVIAGCGLSPTLADYAALSWTLPQIEQDTYEETQALLERAVAGLDCDVQFEVSREDGCRALLAASERFDLLVLGSRGYGPVGHVLLGSVSAAVMRSAKCPVLVLPHQASVAADTHSLAAHA